MKLVVAMMMKTMMMFRKISTSNIFVSNRIGLDDCQNQTKIYEKEFLSYEKKYL